jgi:hypothetical protein
VFVALFIIWGDFLASSTRCKVGGLVLWMALMFAPTVFLPSPWSDLLTGSVALVGALFGAWWQAEGETMRRRLDAARVAWEMGFDARAAWKWSRQFAGLDK